MGKLSFPNFLPPDSDKLTSLGQLTRYCLCFAKVLLLQACTVQCLFPQFLFFYMQAETNSRNAAAEVGRERSWWWMVLGESPTREANHVAEEKAYRWVHLLTMMKHVFFSPVIRQWNRRLCLTTVDWYGERKLPRILQLVEGLSHPPTSLSKYKEWVQPKWTWIEWAKSDPEKLWSLKWWGFPSF